MIKITVYLLLVCSFFVGCGDNAPATGTEAETTSRGKIKMSVDESFKPVIEEQLKVFRSSFPQAIIEAEYKPEAECLRDLQNDSTRMVIISRGLTSTEHEAYKKMLQYRPIYEEIAVDAIAVVVNVAQADSVFTMDELRQLLSTPNNRNLQVIVDGKTATSTVRFLIDSLLGGKPLGRHVEGAKSSEDLINYVSNTPGAIGFVGVSWITNPQTPQQQEAIGKVKMALIECNKNCEEGEFAKPSQQTIMFQQYPLVRGLHYVLKENFSGVGSGFVNFLTLERGQLIFRRALLVPSIMQFNRRRTNLVEE